MENLITSNLAEIAAAAGLALLGAVILAAWAAIRARAAATPADWDDRIVCIVERIARAVASSRAAVPPGTGATAAPAEAASLPDAGLPGKQEEPKR